MKVPLILTPKGTISFILYPIVSAVNGEAFQYKRSFLVGKRNEIIGIANDLESFYENLANIPLEVFCFHCYRVTNYDLAGVTGKINPRSDIALWIEFSIGDTELAQQIYNVCQQALGTSTSLDRGSKFNQTTIRSSILRLIADRIIFLKTIEA